MRINKFVAGASGLSRRKADEAIADGRVTVNGLPVKTGYDTLPNDSINFDGQPLQIAAEYTTIILNKPSGYVCSRDGQGSQTIYDLIPTEYHALKPVGRLDKDSSGLLLLTDNGMLAYQLTHPKFVKTKVYEVVLDQPLQPMHRQMISDYGIALEDGISKLQLDRLKDDDDTAWQVVMFEGRNRQIRRTFLAVGYSVKKLHRTTFGDYHLDDLKSGTFLLAS